MRQVWYAEMPEASRGCDVALFYYPSLAPRASGFKKNLSVIQCVDTTQSIDRIKAQFNDTTRNLVSSGLREKELVCNVIHVPFGGMEEMMGQVAVDFNAFFHSKHLNIPKLAPAHFSNQEWLLSYVSSRDWGNKYAMNLYAVRGDRMYVLFVANAFPFGSDKGMVARASRLAHYKAFEWAFEHGIGEVSVGPVDKAFPGNAAFKKSFGGREEAIESWLWIGNPLLRLVHDRL